MSRYVTVGSVSESRPAYSIDEVGPVLEHLEKFIRRASKMGCQILAFPEAHYRPEGKYPDVAEELSDRGGSWAMEMACKYDLHLIWPMVTLEGGTIYNSAVLIDRKGEVIGSYHKMNPTKGEIEGGVMPGDEAGVFETEFGRVGMAICFDLNFRNIMEGLRDNGAEVVFFCSAYRGGMQLRWWAVECGYYVVSAIRSDLGQIIDLTGRQLELSTYEALVTHRINLNRRLLHMDYNWGKMDEMLDKYGSDLTFDYVTQEARYAIGSEREGLDIEDVIDEFGLLRLQDYWREANELRAQTLQQRDS